MNDLIDLKQAQFIQSYKLFILCKKKIHVYFIEIKINIC